MTLFIASPNLRSTVTFAALATILSLSIVACGGGAEEAAEEARRRQPTLAPPATLAPLASPSEEAEETRDAEDADLDADSGADASQASGSEDDVMAEPRVVELPADGKTPVIQIARIENTPWEPQILAQMTPHFSLQADGFVVFASPYGDTDVGWHQTVISQADVLSLLKLLVEEIGVLELAETIGEDSLQLETAPDGSPVGCDAYGVIAIRTAADQGRFIISECALESPSGDEAGALGRLHEVVNTIERWKSVVDHTGLTPETKSAFRQLMGWYSEIRQPYSPESAVGFGTLARGSIPASASVSGWPLDLPLAESFGAEYGATPSEVVISGADLQRSLQSSLAFALERPRSYWGPLYADADGTLYSVAVRPAVPGANNVVVDYDYTVPRRGIGVGR